VKKMNGEGAHDQTEMYFKTLLNNVPDTQKAPYEVDAPAATLPIYTANFTLEEVGRAVRKLKNGGAPGSDYAVIPEAIKFRGEALREKLREACNVVLQTLQPPKQWQTNIIIPLPKKGNSHKMQDYRGFSYVSCGKSLKQNAT